MSDTVKISWSGGKDSTAATLLHLEAGHICKIVNFVPMLTQDIPLIRKDHYDFIRKAASRFESAGGVVYQAIGMTYWDHVHRIKVRGKYKGRPYGAGLGLGFCGFRDRVKIYAIDHVVVGPYDYQDIGIASDEIRRHGQLTEDKRSILVEHGITEQQALAMCEEAGLLSPIYRSTGRDGCAICPNAKREVFLQWLNDWPGAYEILMEIEEYCKSLGGEHERFTPYRHYMWWSDRIAGRC